MLNKNDVIDIKGQLYTIESMTVDGEHIELTKVGEIVRAFVRPQNEEHESDVLVKKKKMIDSLQCYCDKQNDCHRWLEGVEIPCRLYDSVCNCIWTNNCEYEDIIHDYDLIVEEI